MAYDRSKRAGNRPTRIRNAPRPPPPASDVSIPLHIVRSTGGEKMRRQLNLETYGSKLAPQEEAQLASLLGCPVTGQYNLSTARPAWNSQHNLSTVMTTLSTVPDHRLHDQRRGYEVLVYQYSGNLSAFIPYVATRCDLEWQEPGVLTDVALDLIERSNATNMADVRITRNLRDQVERDLQAVYYALDACVYQQRRYITATMFARRASSLLVVESAKEPNGDDVFGE